MSHSTSVHGRDPILRLVAWEITRSCPLSCRHCRASAQSGPYQGELSTSECFSVLDSIAKMGSCIIILTGGEPMLRSDIFEISRYGTQKGLRMVMATCGSLLTETSCKELRDSGISRISLSIDGADALSHDTFRGVDGAYEIVMKAITLLKDNGIEFQINTTITKSNVGELKKIYETVVELGAVAFHPFLLVPTGRGSALTSEIISAQEYEQVLNEIYEISLEQKILVKPTCAPHYYRILREREREQGRSVTRETHGLDALTKGCLGGQGFAFISHRGIVQICGFLDMEAGDLRSSQYNFQKIWSESTLFKQIRAVNEYHGKCGYCEYRMVCGGCRARAFTINGDFLGEEPQCLYTPASSLSTSDNFKVQR
ncbi:MAG: radical SAM protein [Chitinispirillaceae bacterium]|nr:radical SAM protein [Chitinispirillaceae bacterium]